LNKDKAQGISNPKTHHLREHQNQAVKILQLPVAEMLLVYLLYKHAE
jgi:hypothetical protein